MTSYNYGYNDSPPYLSQILQPPFQNDVTSLTPLPPTEPTEKTVNMIAQF